MYLAAEHFVRAPGWTFYILGYFFFAGLSGGSYAIATLLRVVGDARDEPAARIGFFECFFFRANTRRLRCSGVWSWPA